MTTVLTTNAVLTARDMASAAAPVLGILRKV